MIRNIKYYILLIAVTLSTASCLDKYPEDAIQTDKAITTVEEANQLVIGIYSQFKNSYLYSGSLTLLPDIQSDLVYAVEGYSNIYGDIWRWETLSTNAEVAGVYGALNAVIGQCNFLLEKVAILEKNVNDDDYEQLQAYKGEAYFARALAYSELIKLFCKAYDPKTAANELGVVLSSSYSESPVLKRASLKDSYQFVLDDLAKAAEYLEVDEDDDSTLYNLPYFSEYTVHALYARVYLYMKDWNKAIEYATKVIDSKKYQLASTTKEYMSGVSYFRYMWQYDQSTEIIWKVGFTTTSYGGRLGQVFFNAIGTNYKPDYVPAEWALNLYSDTDLRASTYFVSAQTSYTHHLTWPLLAKYFGNQTFLDMNMYHICMPKVFRLAEQYLIRAEAYCRLENNPQFGKASDDLTTLLKSRYESFGSISVTKDNWFNTINEERVKELFMEGFRLQDLKRWGADKLINGFTRKPQTNSLSIGSSLKIDASNPLFVWPIPQHELDIPGSQIEPNESNR